MMSFGTSKMTAVRQAGISLGLRHQAVRAAWLAALVCLIHPEAKAAGVVQIDSLSPGSGSAGTSISIEGFGFTSDNTVHFGETLLKHVPINRAIAFSCAANAPGCRSGIHQWLEIPVPDIAPGAYPVWVETQDGKSPAMTFTVTR